MNRSRGRIASMTILPSLALLLAVGARGDETKAPEGTAASQPAVEAGAALNPQGAPPSGEPGMGAHRAPPPEVQKQIDRERASDEKVRTLQQAAQAHPGEARYQVALIDGLLESRHDDQALLVAPPLIEKFPRSAEMSVSFGRALLRDGQFDLAAVQFQRAIGLDGSLATSHLLAGKTAVIQGDLKMAEAELRKALSLEPHSMEVRSALSLVLERTERYAEAIDVLSLPASKGGAVLSGKRSLLQHFVKSPPFVLPPSFASVTVPFVQARGYPPFVKVVVGESIERLFVIDTASDELLLTPEAAKALGLPEKGKETVKDEDGKEHLTPVYTILDRMKVGDTTIRRIPVRVSPGLRYPDDRIAGAIGRDFLRRFRVTLDYSGKTLTLDRAGGASIEGTSFGLASVILVEGQIGDQGVGRFVVDSSSFTPGAMDAKFVAEITGKSLFSPDVKRINEGPYLFKFTMPSLKVAGAEFSNFSATAVDLRTMAQQIGVNVRGVIGLSLLRQCRVVIDFKNQRMSMTRVATPTPSPAEPAS